MLKTSDSMQRLAPETALRIGTAGSVGIRHLVAECPEWDGQTPQCGIDLGRCADMGVSASLVIYEPSMPCIWTNIGDQRRFILVHLILRTRRLLHVRIRGVSFGMVVEADASESESLYMR